MKKTAFIIVITIIANTMFSQTLSLVSDVNVGGNSSFPHYLTEFNNKTYFVAGNGMHFKLYASDGTNSGTQLIGPTIGNGVVWFLTKYNNKLYFTYDDGIHGLELWTSDGSTAGTHMLKDIWTGTTAGGTPYSSLPSFFTVCNGLLFFQASTPTRNQGLWVTDGTMAGTQMLGNQYCTPFGSSTNFIVLNTKIYFQGNAGSGYGLWSSDGTTAGTQLIKSGFVGVSGASHAILGNKFYFQNGNNTNGQELWASDGTSAGTNMIRDINTVGFSSDPQNFFADSQKVYFEANDGISGRELWITDGTSLGTQLLKDIAVGASSAHPGSGSPKGIIAFNNQVYFFGNSGFAVEMYKTDGTLAGTSLIKSFPSIFTVTYSFAFNNKFYFVGATSVGGTEYLFESDGTTAGTFQINPSVNTYSSNPNGFNLLGFANELYVPAYFGSQGNELCKLTFPSLGNTDWIVADSFQVFPNPTKDKIAIHLVDDLLDATISITNLQGQRLHQSIITSTNHTLDLAGVPPGIYALSLQKKDKLFIQKIIKN